MFSFQTHGNLINTYTKDWNSTCVDCETFILEGGGKGKGRQDSTKKKSLARKTNILGVGKINVK